MSPFYMKRSVAALMTDGIQNMFQIISKIYQLFSGPKSIYLPNFITFGCSANRSKYYLLFLVEVIINIIEQEKGLILPMCTPHKGLNVLMCKSGLSLSTEAILANCSSQL